MGTFLVTSPCLDNVTDDYGYSRLFADYPSVERWNLFRGSFSRRKLSWVFLGGLFELSRGHPGKKPKRPVKVKNKLLKYDANSLPPAKSAHLPRKNGLRCFWEGFLSLAEGTLVKSQKGS